MGEGQVVAVEHRMGAWFIVGGGLVRAGRRAGQHPGACTNTAGAGAALRWLTRVGQAAPRGQEQQLVDVQEQLGRRLVQAQREHARATACKLQRAGTRNEGMRAWWGIDGVGRAYSVG